MKKSLIVKKLDIEDEDLLFMILELHTSVVSCFGVKVNRRNMDLFHFCIYFGILPLLYQEVVITVNYHVQTSFISKKDKKDKCWYH